MCDFIRKLLGISSKPDAAAAAALQQQQVAAANALAAQQQALAQEKAAADSASETDQLAKEARLRKLASAGTFGASFNSPNFAAPGVATRQLFGAA